MLKINRKEELSIVSNLFFVVPLYIGLQQKKYIFALFIALAFISSMLFHIFKEPGIDWWWKPAGTPLQVFFLYLDTLFASILAVMVLNEITKNGFGINFWIPVILYIPSALILFNDNEKEYVHYHSLWHFLTSAILVLALVL